MRPLSRQALKQLKEYYRIGLTYSSNALEGNSLTETETKIVLEDGITIGGKPLKDHSKPSAIARPLTCSISWPKSLKSRSGRFSSCISSFTCE